MLVSYNNLLNLKGNKTQFIAIFWTIKRRNFELFFLFYIKGRGSYTKLFDHMAFDHNFSVGQPDNLVYITELLDLLEGKLENLVCLAQFFRPTYLRHVNIFTSFNA
jgi:hypothetical protein